MDTLNIVAQIAAIIGAATLILVAPLEMIFYDRPFARRLLNVDTTNVDDARLWAFCIGARNIFAAVGTFIGLIMIWTDDPTTGLVVVIVASWYMLLSAIAMGVADLLGFWRPRGGSIAGVFGSGIPPLVVLIAAPF
ncbi:MAG TPA: DUF1304 family protein [Enteractinococcus sp.]